MSDKHAIDAEIEREMTIKELAVPKDLSEPHLREEHLTDFDKRDQRMLMSMAVLQRQQAFTIETLVKMNQQMRYIEAEQIRQRREQRELNSQGKMIRWVSVTVGAGFIAAFVQIVARKLFP